MKIITLSGGKGTGKTTTLKALYKRLKDSGAKDVYPPVSCPSSGSDEEYFIEFNGKHIGIVTSGDYSLETIWYMGVYYGRNSDILVIANSNKSRPFDIIKWHSLQTVDIIKVSISECNVEDTIIKEL